MTSDFCPRSSLLFLKTVITPFDFLQDYCRILTAGRHMCEKTTSFPKALPFILSHKLVSKDVAQAMALDEPKTPHQFDQEEGSAGMLAIMQDLRQVMAPLQVAVAAAQQRMNIVETAFKSGDTSTAAVQAMQVELERIVSPPSETLGGPPAPISTAAGSNPSARGAPVWAARTHGGGILPGSYPIIDTDAPILPAGRQPPQPTAAMISQAVAADQTETRFAAFINK